MARHSLQIIIRVGGKWIEQIRPKSESIPVPCEFVSRSSEAFALPLSFHLGGLDQEEEQGG